MNEEKPDVTMKRKPLQSSYDTIGYAEYRLFKKFIFLHSLRGLPAFFVERSTDVQIDTLYRLREVCRKNDHQPVWKKTTEDYDLFVVAHEEAVEFKTFMENVWQEYFEIICKHPLSSTRFDEEISLTSGSAEGLSSFLKSFKRHRPHLYAQKNSIIYRSLRN